MLRVGELLERVKGLPPDTIVCVAELDEAFAASVAQLEVVEDAKAGRSDAEAMEAVELGHGKDRVVVLRW